MPNINEKDIKKLEKISPKRKDKNMNLETEKGIRLNFSRVRDTDAL